MISMSADNMMTDTMLSDGFMSADNMLSDAMLPDGLMS
jgi:hypothetical protein